MKPLENIKVVELGTHIAAPAASRMMADWGADVIKVETISGESYRTVGRAWKMPFDENNNPIIQPHNGNKRSLSLNLKSADGKEALLKLLDTADVFITNTRPQALERLGLDYETVKARCPKLVYALFTAYGLVGPDKDAPGFDTAAYWGRGGMLLDWTAAEYTPFRAHPGFGDCTVASAMLAGIVAALFRRVTTGEGDFVTGSLYGSALWYNFHGIVEAQYPGHDVPISRYAVSQPSAPMYKCADKYFFIVEQQYEAKFPEFFRKIGLPELADDPKFVTIAESRKNMETVVRCLDEKYASIPYAVIDKACSELNMVHSYVASCSDAIADPQAWDNGYLKKLVLENGDELTIPATPISFASFKPDAATLTPHLGADSYEILSSLGYSEEKIRSMVAEGAVNTHGK